jgi:hypothetical protein
VLPDEQNNWIDFDNGFGGLPATDLKHRCLSAHPPNLGSAVGWWNTPVHRSGAQHQWCGACFLEQQPRSWHFPAPPTPKRLLTVFGEQTPTPTILPSVPPLFMQKKSPRRVDKFCSRFTHKKATTQAQAAMA